MSSLRLPVLMLVVGLGLGVPIAGYYLLWSPLVELHQRQETMGNELAKALKEKGDHEKIRKDILMAHPRLEDWRKLSWPEAKSKPADRHLNDMQAEYRRQLERIMSASELSKPLVELAMSSAKTGGATPRQGARKALWQSTSYRLIGQGSLQKIAQVLEGVYQLPTLHRIANLTIKRSDAEKKNLTKDSLEMILTVEAIEVTGSEKRDDLLPSVKEPKYSILNSKREHSLVLAQSNPFILPTPPAPVRPPTPPTPVVVREEKPKEDREEYLTGVKLTGVSSYERGSRSGWVAQFYDQNNNADKKVYSLGFRKTLEISDIYGNEVLSAEVVLMGERYLVMLVDGAYYKIIIGEDIYPSGGRVLTAEEYLAIGLKTPPKPQPKKTVVDPESDS